MMIKLILTWIKELFQNPSLDTLTINTDNTLASEQYIKDFEWDLYKVFMASGLGYGVYKHESLYLEVTPVFDSDIFFDCVVYDKHLNVLWSLGHRVFCLKEFSIHMADNVLEEAKFYLFKDWVKEIIDE